MKTIIVEPNIKAMLGIRTDTRPEKKPVYWAANRGNRTVTILTGFRCWEEVQAAFRVGLIMPDNTSADGIGRSRSVVDFTKRANNSQFVIL